MIVGYIITTVMSVISGTLVFMVQNLLKENNRLREAKKQSEDKKQKAIGDGVLSLLKIQLIEYHEKYMTNGNIPTYVYDNFDEMYKAYEALGGNGMVKHMKEDIDRLRMENKGL